MNLLARSVICVLLFCLPLLLYILASGSAETSLILFIPFVGLIPALLGAWLLFSPLEALLDFLNIGNLRNIILPLAGGLLPLIVFAIIIEVSGDRRLILNRLSTGGMNEWGPLLFWIVLGVIWGGLWRISEWVLRHVRNRFGV